MQLKTRIYADAYIPANNSEANVIKKLIQNAPNASDLVDVINKRLRNRDTDFYLRYHYSTGKVSGDIYN